jgi:hypothetical protein
MKTESLGMFVLGFVSSAMIWAILLSLSACLSWAQPTHAIIIIEDMTCVERGESITCNWSEWNK